MENRFVAGALKSPLDERDFKVMDLIGCACAGPIPDEYQPPIAAPIFNQGESSECVACSISTVRFIQEAKQSGNTDAFSPSFIYGNRSDTDHEGEGMFPREALKHLQKDGTCFYKDFPGFYSADEAESKLKTALEGLLPLAHPYRITSYYAVSDEIEIKNTVQHLGAVSAMFPVFKCLYDTKKDGIVKYNGDDSQKNYGFHQMTIIGWTSDSWIIQNSWGEDWGKKGICYLPLNYPIEEAWAITDDVHEAKFKA